MTLTYEQRQAALLVLKECIDKANAYFDAETTVPTLEFNQRGKIAGTAHLQRNLIKLNAVLMTDNMNIFLKNVIPHEVAHIVVYQQYGRVKPHGSQWQTVMRNVLGANPEVRHSMDVSKTQGQTYRYQCECGPVTLSVRRHNKVQRGQQKYLCRKCAQVLIAVEH